MFGGGCLSWRETIFRGVNVLNPSHAPRFVDQRERSRSRLWPALSSGTFVAAVQSYCKIKQF